MKRFDIKNKWKGSERSVITLVTLFALCVGLIATAVTATHISEQNRIDQRNISLRQLDGITSQISIRISAYNQLLISSGALFSVKPETTREEWRNFVDNLNLSERYPSILGMGYVEFFPASGVAEHENKIKQNGLENYHVYPSLEDKNREFVSAITYLEPTSPENLKAVGYDMFSEETRQSAMQKAIDTAEVAISAPVDLVQFAGQPDAPKGILAYYPIYRTGKVPVTVTERRQQVIGFSYVVILPQTFIEIISRAGSVSESKINLTDISVQPPILLSEKAEIIPEKDRVSQITRATDRVWRVSIAHVGETPLQKWLPTGILIAGIVLSTLISALIFRMLAKRIDILASEYNQRIQETKDDMLALASHQLRTPASGVKQYIGMLTQGFVGELNEQQQAIAEKAFKANERQLEIINQMLYVAKADAGQLLIEPEKINLLELAKNAISLQRNTASNKNINLVLDSTRSVSAFGDPRYVSMIIENLISNAIKYTQPEKSVVIRVFVAEQKACLSVSDEGVGIPKKDLSKVFEKFSRIENPLTHSEGGNGLGLYLAYGLAKAHGGELEVASELKVGSTFTLSLPRKKQAKDKIRVSLDELDKEMVNKRVDEV